MSAERKIYFEDDTISTYEIWLAVIRRKLLIAIIALLAMSGAAVYAFSELECYKASNVLIVKTNLLKTGSSAQDDIDKDRSPITVREIRSILSVGIDSSKAEKARMFGMKDADMMKVKEIRTFEIKASETEASKALKIEMDVLDRTVAESLVIAVKDYINNLPYIHNLLSREKEIVRKNIADLEHLIKDPSGYLNFPDNIMISEALLSIYQIKSEYNELLIKLKELEKGELVVTSGETFVSLKPYKPHRPKIIILGLAIGIVLGVFIALLLEWFSIVRIEYEAKRL